jgi:hypothetical protein
MILGGFCYLQQARSNSQQALSVELGPLLLFDLRHAPVIECAHDPNTTPCSSADPIHPRPLGLAFGVLLQGRDNCAAQYLGNLVYDRI